ncbi:MAG: hypothetical protein M3071_05805 [Actinomycetota bacterium]|nr:hypothetical protein [Actinomycetota bacterium]
MLLRYVTLDRALTRTSVREFAPVRCPSGRAAAALATTRERLGCRECTGTARAT